MYYTYSSYDEQENWFPYLISHSSLAHRRRVTLLKLHLWSLYWYMYLRNFLL